MVQVNADWTTQFPSNIAKEKLKEEFNLEFKGPGWYLTKTDSLLILPLPAEDKPNIETIWHAKQPAGTVFQIYVYNTQLSNTIFGVGRIAPTRVDNR